MGSYAALAHTTWVAGYDMTGDLNNTKLDLSYEPRDVTAFGSTARNRVAGLEDIKSSNDGFWQAGTGQVDPAAFAGLTGLQVVTQTVSGTEGDVAYIYQARQLSYKIFGKLGDPLPFSLGLVGARGAGTLSAGAPRGRLSKAKGSVSATGALGTGYQLGAVTAGHYVYASFHVFSAGTTITVVVESDDNAGFTSATTRATLGPLTTTGGTWATRAAGAITDDYWRFRVTAITGTFTVGGVIAIR